MIIGYTSGVFDLFHIGHLKILNRAKKNCDFLIVGVTTDDLMMEYKKKTCVIPFKERSQIVANIKSVDKVVAQDSMDKLKALVSPVYPCALHRGVLIQPRQQCWQDRSVAGGQSFDARS